MLSKLLKRFLLSALFVSLITILHGQFNIVPLSAGGIYLKSQLWNISISNNNSAVEARIQLNMKDIQTQETILSAISSSFNISPGVQVINPQSIEPIIYTYGSGAVTDLSDNGMLPVGQYQVCYQLLFSHNEDQVVGADDCEEIEVEPLSPPLLVTPENDSFLVSPTPNFKWVPPTPITMFTDLNYDISISEVHDGQSITEAIQSNLPLQQLQNLQQPFFSYSSSGPQLEMGKRYAWQIIARDHQRFASKSEVWSFRTAVQNIAPKENNLVYLLMDDKANGTGVTDSDTLHVKYVSYLSAHEVSLIFRNDKGIEIHTLTREIKLGDNYLDIPLNKHFLSKHNYTVFIIENGKVNSLAFIIK